jgi:tRNA pseudouridine38-40 synthase
MARYQVILAYDGTRFHGSQRQLERRTVQGVVEQALRKLNWDAESVLLAGRTDAGVHASGQVVAFDLEWRHPSADLRNALNSLLPNDVAVRHVAECRADFHPRFDAVSRSYRYWILCDEVRRPLEEYCAWRVWPAPDVERLIAAASELIGEYDFAAFGSPTRDGGSTIRQVSNAVWKQDDNKLSFEITANAFLYHMVRRLVYVQILVGQGVHQVEDIRQCLANPTVNAIQGLAPAQGLSLVAVGY